MSLRGEVEPAGRGGRLIHATPSRIDDSIAEERPVLMWRKHRAVPAVAGESIVVSAKWMWDQCLPAGWNTPGVTPGERVPETDLRVVWRQGSAESVLDTVDANADGVVELSVTVPDDAQPGAADITIDTAVSATVTVEPAN